MFSSRALGASLMAVGALVMAYALVLAGNARMTLYATLEPFWLALMRQAWAGVAGGAALVLAGTWILQRAAEREARAAPGA